MDVTYNPERVHRYFASRRLGRCNPQSGSADVPIVVHACAHRMIANQLLRLIAAFSGSGGTSLMVAGARNQRCLHLNYAIP
jgi:hypothetical protein